MNSRVPPVTASSNSEASPSEAALRPHKLIRRLPNQTGRTRSQSIIDGDSLNLTQGPLTSRATATTETSDPTAPVRKHKLLSRSTSRGKITVSDLYPSTLVMTREAATQPSSDSLSKSSTHSAAEPVHTQPLHQSASFVDSTTPVKETEVAPGDFIQRPRTDSHSSSPNTSSGSLPTPIPEEKSSEPQPHGRSRKPSTAPRPSRDPLHKTIPSITSLLKHLVTPNNTRLDTVIQKLNSLFQNYDSLTDEDKIIVNQRINDAITSFLSHKVKEKNTNALFALANISNTIFSSLHLTITTSLLTNLIKLFTQFNDTTLNTLIITEKLRQYIIIELRHKLRCYTSLYRDTNIDRSSPITLLGSGTYGTTYQVPYHFSPQEIAARCHDNPDLHSGFYVFKPDLSSAVNIQGAAQSIGINAIHPLFTQRSLASFIIYRLLCKTSPCWKLLNVVGTYPAHHERQTGIVMQFAQGIPCFVNSVFTLGEIIPTSLSDSTHEFNRSELEKAEWNNKGIPTNSAAYKILLTLYSCDRIIKHADGTYQKAYKVIVQPDFNDPILRRIYVLMSLFDLITQQVDRNPTNRLIRFDLLTSAVTGFTLFDHDIAFGSRNIDPTTLKPNDFTNGGLFLVTYPPIIDTDMQNSLQSLKLDELRIELQPFLPSVEIALTIERIQQLKTHYHPATLKNYHCIDASEWSTSDTKEVLLKPSDTQVHSSYFQREFQMHADFALDPRHAQIPLASYQKLQELLHALNTQSPLPDSSTSKETPLTLLTTWLYSKLSFASDSKMKPQLAIELNSQIHILNAS